MYSALELVTFLNKHEFRASLIPTADNCQQERADLFITDDGANYVIEVKDKKSLTKDSIRAERGGVMLEKCVENYAYVNRIDGVLTKASAQLKASQQQYPGFQLAWINLVDFYTEVTTTQVVHTWYGAEWLSWRGTTSGQNTLCLYYCHSSSYRHSNIVAVVVATNTSGPTVYYNEFCPDLSRFRDSKLCEFFDYYVDPQEKVESGEVLAYKGNASRSQPAEVLQDLERQFGKRFFPTPVCRTTVTAQLHRKP